MGMCAHASFHILQCGCSYNKTQRETHGQKKIPIGGGYKKEVIKFLSFAALRCSKARPGQPDRAGAILPKSVEKRDGQESVWAAQVRPDRVSFRIIETAASQPRLTSRRRAKSI